jgi:hypothetical protein
VGNDAVRLARSASPAALFAISELINVRARAEALAPDSSCRLPNSHPQLGHALSPSPLDRRKRGLARCVIPCGGANEAPKTTSVGWRNLLAADPELPAPRSASPTPRARSCSLRRRGTCRDRGAASLLLHARQGVLDVGHSKRPETGLRGSTPPRHAGCTSAGAGGRAPRR